MHVLDHARGAIDPVLQEYIDLVEIEREYEGSLLLLLMSRLTLMLLRIILHFLDNFYARIVACMLPRCLILTLNRLQIYLWCLYHVAVSPLLILLL